MSIDARVDGPDLGAFARRLKQAGRTDLKRELTRAIRRAVKPVIADLKEQALAIPAVGQRSTGLRARIAAAIRTEIRTGANRSGVRVKVDRSKMGDQASLPAAFDKDRLRHPVFGNREEWVTQLTHSEGWFSRTSTRRAPAIRRAIEQAMADVARQIEGP